MRKKKIKEEQDNNVQESESIVQENSDSPETYNPVHSNFGQEEYIIEEDKFIKNSSLRQDHELFDEELNKPNPVITVRRIEYSDAEDWEILSDKKVSLVIKGVRFTAKEKDYFRTPDGMRYLIQGFKAGWKSVSEFKRNLK